MAYHFIDFSLISENDGESRVEEGQFAHTIGKNVVAIGRSGEDFWIWPELLSRTTEIGFATTFTS